MAFACLIRKLIIQRRGTPTAYLVGYGIVIPAALYTPYYLLQVFELRNKSLKLAMGTVATVVFFRCIEAMYGTASHTVESSMRVYAEYYTSLTPFEWDPKTRTRRKITSPDVLVKK